MAIQARCPGCGAVIRAGGKYAGRQVKCPRCTATISMPAEQPRANEGAEGSSGATAEAATAATAADVPAAPPAGTAMAAAGSARPPAEPHVPQPVDDGAGLPFVQVEENSALNWRQAVSKPRKAPRGRGRKTPGWLWPAVGGACLAAIAAGVFVATRSPEPPDRNTAAQRNASGAAERDAERGQGLAAAERVDDPLPFEPDAREHFPAAADGLAQSGEAGERAVDPPSRPEPVEQDLVSSTQRSERAAASRAVSEAAEEFVRSQPAGREAGDDKPPAGDSKPAEGREPAVSVAEAAPAAPADDPADEGLSPQEVLDKHGIRIAGDHASLDEPGPKLRTALSDARRLRLNLRNAFNDAGRLERRLRELKNLHGQRSAALAQVNATRPGDVTANNLLVGQLNAIAAEAEQVEQAVRAARSKLAQVREVYVQHLLKTRAIVDEVQREYAEKSATPSVAAALAQLSKGDAGLALAPSGGFARDVRALEDLERQVLSEAVPARVESGNLHVSVVINGQHTVEMMVDSGASLISIPHSMAVAWGLEPKPSDPVSRFEIADGSIITGRIITIPSVRVGKFTVENVEAGVLPPEARNATPLLGMSFLGKFEVKLDSNRGQLILGGLEVGDEPRRGR